MQHQVFSFIFFFILIFSISSCAVNKNLSVKKNNLTLGNKKVKLISVKNSMGGLTFFNMHDDENASVVSAKKYLQTKPGHLVELKHSGGRYISFKLNGNKYKVDPNRIFTPAGIKSTLEKHSQYDPLAQKEVAIFAKQLLDFLEISKLKEMVAIHNNKQNGYSLLSYIKGGPYETDAKYVHQNKMLDWDDFFFVTDEQLYEQLKDINWNVILQNNEIATDDGSLSVYCGQKGIKYVNVEAQRRKVKTQLAMYLELEKVLKNE